VLFVEIAAPTDEPPGPQPVRDLVSLIQQCETEDIIKVVVFKSADPDCLISHVDVTRIADYRAEAWKLTGDCRLPSCFTI
jgi:hypothetical protein